MKFKHALIHNTGWKIITMLFTFLNNIIIVRMLGVDASANFFYAIAAFTLLSTILRAGLENGIVYFVSKQPEKTKPIAQLLSAVLIIQTFITIVIFRIFLKEIVGFTFFCCVLYVISNVLVYYVSAFYQVKKMFISLNISGCIIVLCQTILLCNFYLFKTNFLVTAGFAKNKNDSILIIFTFSILIQMVFLCIHFYKKNKEDFNYIPQLSNITKNIFSYSLINFGVTVLFFLVLRADLFFVEKYCAKVELGNYLQASKIGQMLLVFPGLIGGVIFPYTVQAANDLAVKVALLCRILTMLFFIGFLAFLLVGPHFFPWLLGKDFNLMYGIFAASFFGIYCLSVNILIISFFEGINKQAIILWALLVTFFIIVVADFLLVPIYGYFAAPAIFSIANFVGLLFLVKTFKNETEILYKNIFIFDKTDLKLLIST